MSEVISVKHGAQLAEAAAEYPIKLLQPETPCLANLQ